jgi:hypothetical protein
MPATSIARRLKSCRELIYQFLVVEKIEFDPAKEMWEQTYKERQKDLSTTRKAAAASAEKVLELEVRVDVTRESLTEFNFENPQTSKDAYLKKIEQLLVLEKRHLRVLRVRLTNLEFEVHSAYTKKQVYAARSAAAVSLKRANYYLSKSNTKSIADLLGEKELEIEQTEKLGLKIAISENVENTTWLSRQLEAERSAETWEMRSELARQQNKEDLAKEALNRSIPFRNSSEQFAELHLVYCKAQADLERHLQNHIALQEEISRKTRYQAEDTACGAPPKVGRKDI